MSDELTTSFFCSSLHIHYSLPLLRWNISAGQLFEISQNFLLGEDGWLMGIRLAFGLNRKRGWKWREVQSPLHQFMHLGNERIDRDVVGVVGDERLMRCTR